MCKVAEIVVVGGVRRWVGGVCVQGWMASVQRVRQGGFGCFQQLMVCHTHPVTCQPAEQRVYH